MPDKVILKFHLSILRLDDGWRLIVRHGENLAAYFPGLAKVRRHLAEALPIL